MTEYQKQTKTTAIYRDSILSFVSNAPIHRVVRLLELNYAAMGLADEAGEVLGKVKKLLRDDLGVLTPSREAEIRKEIGDVQYYAHELANLLGFDMEEIQAENAAKLASRKERGVLQGSGDNR